ncbi:MAG TPA: acylphosphatase [Candidatus Krumholzibacteriaceae bacterium]|nr:acylphosphatase [Candidatus Krumholzibacteriaceae bacterium]
MIRAHLLIRGRVQGVGYRANARRVANQLNLKGWIRNTPNGDVEAVVEGSEETVDRLIQWCHRGPTGAHVTEVRVEKEEATGVFLGFTVRRTWP